MPLAEKQDIVYLKSQLVKNSWISKMRHKAHQVFAGATLSDLFDLDGDGHLGAQRLRDFDLREDEVCWWRMPRSFRVSRAIRDGSIRNIGNLPLSNPLELFRVIGSHAMAARSLIYQLREPAYWVRRGDPVSGSRYFRPALPEVHLSDLLEVPTRQVRPALQPLLEDGAVELVRSPAGVRAVLVCDGFVEEDRLKARLRA